MTKRQVPGERAAALRAGGSPASLARTATRAELRQPGVLERALGACQPPQRPGRGDQQEQVEDTPKLPQDQARQTIARHRQSIGAMTGTALRHFSR